MEIDWDAMLLPAPAECPEQPPAIKAVLVMPGEKIGHTSGDDRHYCTECGRYRGRICTLARPGGTVSASRNYEPVLYVSHRCNGFVNVGA